MKISWKSTQSGKYGARTIAVFVGLLGSVMLGPSRAYAQAEIDRDHFDSSNAQPVPQLVRLLRYEGTFSLPYSVLGNGQNLASEKYSISPRFDGKVGRATLNQKKHAIVIARGVPTVATKQRDEVVALENNQTGRTLSVARVSGFDFVFDREHSAHPYRWQACTHQKVAAEGVVRNETQPKSLPRVVQAIGAQR